jgi:hypothetical protein
MPKLCARSIWFATVTELSLVKVRLLHPIVPDTTEIVKELGGARQNTLRRVRGTFFGQRGYLFADIRVA